MTTLSNISVDQLKRAVAVREQIESLERELAAILGEPGGNGRRGRRTMSASARAKIAAAQRARWAKQKGKRRTMSAAARAKIAAAARARWAKAKAANRRTLAG